MGSVIMSRQATCLLAESKVRELRGHIEQVEHKGDPSNWTEEEKFRVRKTAGEVRRVLDEILRGV